jgi:hypothetical protein
MNGGSGVTRYTPSRRKTIAVGLPISAALYLTDCLIAIYVDQIHPELPWFERGLYLGPATYLTFSWTLAWIAYCFIGKTR